MPQKVNIFISHISDEQSEASKAKDYLEQVFAGQVDVFLASSWASIAPGEDWFERITEALQKADLMIVFCSSDSITRPWIQFETGAGWFAKKKARIIPICHKGMTPRALPEPIRWLQAVDINADSEGERLNKLAEAIKVATGLEASPIPVESVALSPRGSMASLTGWLIRPSAHISQRLEGTFKVGTVAACDPSRARAAALDPDDSIYVRLHVEPPTGQFVHAIAHADTALFFESDDIQGTVVKAELRLAAAFKGHGPDERPVPLIVVEKAERQHR